MNHVDFINNLRKHYPEFCDYLLSHYDMRRGHDMMDFMEDISSGICPSYDILWEYIINNEDKHNWWML